MKKIILAVIIVLLLIFTVTGCKIFTLNFTTDEGVFDIEEIKDLSFKEKSGKSITYIYGNGIVSADYVIAKDTIIIKKDYLITLPTGTHEFTAVSKKNKGKITLTVKDNNRENKIVNGSFETGDLLGWTAKTVFKGEQGILAFKGVSEKTETLDKNDRYYLSSKEEEKLGVITSTDFIVGGCGFITFQLAGTSNPLCYLSVRNYDTDEELARYVNPYNDSNEFTTYRADLSKYIGQRVFVELCDYSIRDKIKLDSLFTYYKEEPSGMLAVDVKPSFDVLYPTNQVNNGDFSQGLNGYTQINFNGEGDTFKVDGNILKSNVKGDASVGLIRSSVFTVDGSGIVSLSLGAGQGEKFDKSTFVSIKEYKTNRELFRLANVKKSGNDLFTYYIDLSANLGAKCYFEIVDNATNAWDVIFVGEIKTYYKQSPEYSFGNAGQNLNH